MSQKSIFPLMFDNNFSKCTPVFKILLPIDLCMEILYVQTTKISTIPAICCYTTLWKLKMQKCCLIWQHPQQTVDMFLRDTLRTWFNMSQDCLKTADIEWLIEVCQTTSRINSWTLLHHGDFFTTVIFASSSFYAIFRMLYTYSSKIVSVIFL